jgi:2-iminobutanoate/2-iminopropanoate deaminase
MPGTAPPGGPYRNSARIGNLIAVSGQIGNLADRSLADGLEEQARVALRNMRLALEACGASLHDVLTVGVYLTDVADFPAMNQVYGEVFAAPYPARTTVYVGLKPGVLVEFDALAVLPDSSTKGANQHGL